MIDKLIKPVSDIVGKFVKDKDLQALMLSVISEEEDLPDPKN